MPYHAWLTLGYPYMNPLPSMLSLCGAQFLCRCQTLGPCETIIRMDRMWQKVRAYGCDFQDNKGPTLTHILFHFKDTFDGFLMSTLHSLCHVKLTTSLRCYPNKHRVIGFPTCTIFYISDHLVPSCLGTNPSYKTTYTICH
jgi:hypothetical protein